MTQGVRHASYCKLPAIANSLRSYSTVAFIDSDSFFLHRNVSLPALLKAYAPPAHATPSDRPDGLVTCDRVARLSRRVRPPP